MNAVVTELALRVEVSEDQLAATVVIGPDVDRALLTFELLRDLAQRSGVAITDAVQERLRQIESNPPQPGKAHRLALAQGRAARHGKDGRVEWAARQSVEAQSHYERSAFVTVEAGQCIGRIVPPTRGVDGITVSGQVLTARHGRPADLKLDETIQCEEDGRLIARTAGLLSASARRARIAKALAIPGNVDFSTGNVDFDGDVIINGGVRDCFSVKATGNIRVVGLIEAASIESEGELDAQGGFAGRERGQCRIGGDLRARYLDRVSGRIGGDLIVQREIINCRLTIFGSVTAPHGAIIGGSLVVQGPIHVACLGSAAAVPTELILETVPRLQPTADELQNLLEQFLQHRQRCDAQYQNLRKLCGTGRVPDAVQAQLDPFVRTLERLDGRIQRGQTVLSALQRRIDERKRLLVNVDRTIHAGTIFVVGGRAFRVTDDLKGPLTIRRDADSGAIVYARGDKTLGLLPQVTTSRPAAA